MDRLTLSWVDKDSDLPSRVDKRKASEHVLVDRLDKARIAGCEPCIARRELGIEVAEVTSVLDLWLMWRGHFLLCQLLPVDVTHKPRLS